MGKRDTGPFFDEGEKGIHQDDDMSSAEFLSQYRIGKRLVIALSIVMVGSLGLSINEAFKTRPLVEFKNNEHELELRDINTLAHCLPACLYEDIYSLESIVVPISIAKEIMEPHAPGVIDFDKAPVLWEDNRLHVRIKELAISRYHEETINFNEGATHQQNMLLTASNLLNIASENLSEREALVSNICGNSLGHKTCRKGAKAVKQSFINLELLIAQNKEKVISLVKIPKED